jgi:Tol biopolymer transport system component
MPDGRSLLFYSNRAGPYNVWALPLRGGPPRQLTSGAGPDYLPVVSARGQVLYSNWGHQTDLYLALFGSPDEAHRRLTFNTSENYGARFSPDGERLVYYSDRTGNYEIWLRDMADGRERPLTDSAADDFMPDWSPDGREIVFLSNRGGSVQVWTTKVEGREPPRLLSAQELRTPADYAEGIAFGGPRWSPDGAAIGFIAGNGRGQTLWTVSPRGGQPRPTSLRGVLRFDWFRGSRRVVYLRSQDGTALPALFAADLETGRERRLFESPCAEVAVSPDGLQVAYVRADSHFGMNLFRFPLSAVHSDDDIPGASGPPEAVTRGAGLWHVHGGAWSRDGKSLVYTRDTDRGDIYAIQGFETAKR